MSPGAVWMHPLFNLKLNLYDPADNIVTSPLAFNETLVLLVGLPNETWVLVFEAASSWFVVSLESKTLSSLLKDTKS